MTDLNPDDAMLCLVAMIYEGSPQLTTPRDVRKVGGKVRDQVTTYIKRARAIGVGLIERFSGGGPVKSDD